MSEECLVGGDGICAAAPSLLGSGTKVKSTGQSEFVPGQSPTSQHPWSLPQVHTPSARVGNGVVAGRLTWWVGGWQEGGGTVTSGGRHLQGCYVGMETYINRLRVLQHLEIAPEHRSPGIPISRVSNGDHA